jgi:hypothetical protein
VRPSHGRPRGHRPIVRPSVRKRPRDNPGLARVMSTVDEIYNSLLVLHNCLPGLVFLVVTAMGSIWTHIDPTRAWVNNPQFKSLYGLRQSPWEWNNNLNATLCALHLNPCPSDPSLYSYSVSTSMLLLLVYIDDLMLTGNHYGKIAEVQ